MDQLTLYNSFCNVSQCTSGTFLLEEKDTSATLNKVSICNIPFGALIIKMDKIEFVKLFKTTKAWGFNKHSDYLIITDDKLIFIEMKSATEINQKTSDDCLLKYKSDKCTLFYADKIFEEMLSKNSFFEKREPHFVLLYQNPPIAKTSTSLGTDISVLPNTTPNTFRKIPVANEGTISFFRTI